MISSAIILSFFSLFTLALCLPIPSRENLLHIRQAATSLVNSSDAWTTVIANIGPLVVLVGEKSFKSYIKNCKSWIQYGLYCCAPMGGLSAVISVLRLVGGSLVKTIIGRQHEGSAEVYLDVTSASTGLVGQQFIHGHVSPIVAPDPQREAWFIFRGSTVSQPPSIDSDPKTSQNRRSNAEHYRIAWNSARTISRLFENCKKPALATFAVAVYPTLATQDDNAIFCGGKEDHRMFRNLFRKLYPKAGQSIPLPNESLGIAATCICPIRKYGDPWNGKDEQDELIEKRILKPTNAIAFGFEVCCKGVSAALTISEPRYPKLFVFITLIAEVLMYSAFPLTVSFGNRDIALADVLFAIVGHAVVVLGMMVLVWTIKYATVEYGIAVPPITRAAGFVSKDEPKASHVYTSLRTIYISKMRNDWSWKAQWKFIGESSALVVTGGFISMYLGLRQLKWWTVLICAIISGVSTIVRAAASSSRPPDLSHANTRSGYCLSFGNTFSSFGLAPITSTDEKQKNTLLEFIWPLEEPFESWEVWGPWSLRSRYRSKKREVTLRSSLEPNAILAGLAFDTRNMILISELSDLQCLDPKDDHRERFVSLAFQVATILVCERFLLGRRMRMVIPRVHGLRLLPIVLWIGQNQFRADAAVCMEKDRFADELGSKGIMAGFLARRRYYVGLSLKQVPGIRTAELLCERDFNLLEIAFGFHNFRKYDSENADGIASGRIEGTVAYSHELGHIFAWLPQLVMMILLLEPDSTRTGFQELGFGNIPELIAEKMEQSQSLWLEQNYEPRNLFGRARGGTQEER